MSSWLKLTILGITTAVACLLLAASTSSFYLAAGSDSGVEIRTLPLLPKVVALVISTGALLWALFGDRRHWWQRLDSLWYRVWAGRVGRWFFWLAGRGLKATARAALPSVERTELVLGRSALEAYKALPEGERRQSPDLPGVLERLENGAEVLRARGDTGESLTEAVAALEHLRLALVKRQAGVGSPSDLTLVLERAREIGDHVDRRIAAAAEVQALLE